MTTKAVVLPRAESQLPVPGIDASSIRIASGGHTSDGGASGPLFFWSSTRFHSDFAFDLHAHQGFEILTVIVEGHTHHYDSASDTGADLHAGDLQIIHSGAGIHHREGPYTGARVFQIWLDPDFSRSLQRRPDYQDHRASTLVRREFGIGAVTDLIGEQGPIESDVPGLLFKAVDVYPGQTMTFDLPAQALGFVSVVGGIGRLNRLDIGDDDTVLLEAGGAVVLEATGDEPLRTYVMSLPTDPGYPTVGGRF